MTPYHQATLFIFESIQFLASLYSSWPTSDHPTHPAAGHVAYQAGLLAEGSSRWPFFLYKILNLF
jgi:hypothetical protein